MRVSLAICNYNNEIEIENVLRESLVEFPREDIFVVDDGSTDSSPKIAEKLGIQVIYHHENKGAGAAVRSAIQVSKRLGYEVVLNIASNGKMKPQQKENLLSKIREGYDFVQGSRYMAGSGGAPALPFFRRLTIPTLSFALSFILRKRFTDVTCGYRAMRLSIFDDHRIDLNQSWLQKYELESYIIYKACRLGYKVVQAPVMMDYSHLEKQRTSKIRPIIDWWSILRPYCLLQLGLKN